MQAGKAAETVVGLQMVGTPAEVREAVPREASVAERNREAVPGVVSAEVHSPVGERGAADNPVVAEEAAIGSVVVAETPVAAVAGVAGASHPNQVPASLRSAHLQVAHRYHH
jgi:hypothetical protein